MAPIIKIFGLAFSSVSYQNVLKLEASSGWSVPDFQHIRIRIWDLKKSLMRVSTFVYGCYLLNG